MRARRQTGLFWMYTVSGLIAAGGALATVHLVHISTVLILTLLLISVEVFPISLGRISFQASFPIIYAICVVSGFSSAALIDGILLAVIYLVRHKPLKVTTVTVASRVVSIVMGGWITSEVTAHTFANHTTLNYYLVQLALSAITITVLSSGLVYVWLREAGKGAGLMPILCIIGSIDIAVGWCYDAFMLWLAANPKNTGSGDLGTLYFFMPLTAIAGLAFLFVNLARAKWSMERLLAVSKSINEQQHVQNVLENILKESCALARGDFGILYVVRGTQLVPLYCTKSQFTRENIPIGNGVIGFSAESGEGTIVVNTVKDARYIPRQSLPGVRSLLVVPIKAEGEVAGVLCIGSTNVYGFQNGDLKVLSLFATHAGVAMNNARYIEEREKRSVLEERNRLAREIHDGLAQDLTSVALQIEVMKRTCTPEIRQQLSTIQHEIRDTVATVRQAIYELRPQPYVQHGLVAALEAHITEMQAKHPVRFELDANGWVRRVLSPVLLETVYRIVIEAIQNSVKHAEASQIQVILDNVGSIAKVTVTDNGKGFQFAKMIRLAEERRSFGIDNMYKLSERVGGTLEFDTSPGKGTHIRFEFTIEGGHDIDHQSVPV